MSIPLTAGRKNRMASETEPDRGGENQTPADRLVVDPAHCRFRARHSWVVLVTLTTSRHV